MRITVHDIDIDSEEKVVNAIIKKIDMKTFFDDNEEWISEIVEDAITDNQEVIRTALQGWMTDYMSENKDVFQKIVEKYVEQVIDDYINTLTVKRIDQLIRERLVRMISNGR